MMPRTLFWARLLTGLGLAANGLAMLFVPAGWYVGMPGVIDTGPFNAHLVRDIGCAYLVSGVALAWLGVDLRARPAALTGVGFLLLHAGVHLAETAAGTFTPAALLRDAPAVLLLPLFALGLTVFPTHRSFTPMLSLFRWIARRQLAAFGRRFGYDTAYLHDMLDISPRGFMGYTRVAKLAAHCEDVPLEAWYAAKIVAVAAEDCGPCTQLSVTMAEQAGIPATVLRAIVSGDAEAMGADALLGARFARAVLAHAPEADDLREEVIRRWGPRAMLSLALVVTAARLFPTVKYAMGHAKACVRVTVGGDRVPVARPADALAFNAP